MKLYRCNAAIDERCPYRVACFHGGPDDEKDEDYGHEWDDECYTALCKKFKVRRKSDGRWIRQRVQCEEVQNVHSSDVPS